MNFLKVALGCVRFLLSAVDILDYGWQNLSPMDDTGIHFSNESIPVPTRIADTTAGDWTPEEAAAPVPCGVAALHSALMNAGQHADNASVQRSGMRTAGKSRGRVHATRSAKTARREATKTTLLHDSATKARSVSKNVIWFANARDTTKSGAKSTTAIDHDTANSRDARTAISHPVPITGIPTLSQARLLIAAEMDRVTAGAVGTVAMNQVNATALPPGAQTAALSSTTAISSSSPIAGPPFAYLSSNYSSSQAMASAVSGQFAKARGSSHISVAANGGAQIDATGIAVAAGGDGSHAQMSVKFYGLSVGHVDFVFGTAIASACCAPMLAARVTANGGARGLYSQEMRAFPLSTIPGQVQSRADIAVVSSSLPVVNPGQMMSLLNPRGSPNF
jgi:hypothetical protein